METALSDLRASALAAPGGVDTELLHEVDAALGTSTGALPASLIGAVAQRGHAAPLRAQKLRVVTRSSDQVGQSRITQRRVVGLPAPEGVLRLLPRP